MTEEEWLACTDPKLMLDFLRHKGSDRKNQLFSCGCCRKVWHLLTPDITREVVEISERWSDSRHTQAAANEVDVARERATAYFNSNYMHRNAPAYAAAVSCGYLGLPWVGAQKVYHLLGQNACPTAEPLPDDFFCHIVREIFNPFRSVPISPTVLAWNDGLVVRLARAAYDERHLPAATLDNGRLAVLADALEEAGCTDTDILGHLRGSGPHVRGCWVVDAVLGKG